MAKTECIFFICIRTKCQHVTYFFITLYRTNCLSCSSCPSFIFFFKSHWPIVNSGWKHSWSPKSPMMIHWSLRILVLEHYDAKVCSCSCSYCVVTKDRQICKGMLIYDLNYFYRTCETYYNTNYVAFAILCFTREQ